MTIDELEAKMIEAGVPAGRVYDAEDMLADPHFAAREALVTVEDAEFGAIRMQGVFPKLSATPASIRRPAPLPVGQDTNRTGRAARRETVWPDGWISGGA